MSDTQWTEITLKTYPYKFRFQCSGSKVTLVQYKLDIFNSWHHIREDSAKKEIQKKIDSGKLVLV